MIASVKADKAVGTGHDPMEQYHYNFISKSKIPRAEIFGWSIIFHEAKNFVTGYFPAGQKNPPRTEIIPGNQIHKDFFEKILRDVVDNLIEIKKVEGFSHVKF